jgi:hypothetical protein
MTEVTVFTRRSGVTETHGGERFDGPACVAGRLAWPDSNGYTNRSHTTRFVYPFDPVTRVASRRPSNPRSGRTPLASGCRGLLRSTPLLRSSVLKPCAPATSVTWAATLR